MGWIAIAIGAVLVALSVIALLIANDRGTDGRRSPMRPRSPWPCSRCAVAAAAGVAAVRRR